MISNSTQKSGALAYLALAAVCIIWGTTYLALRVGVTQFPPFLFSLIRFSIAGPLLVIFMLTIGKQKWPDRKTLFNQAVSGILMTTLGVSMVGWAEVYISSGLAAVICSVMPVWTILINVLILKDEKPNWLIITGVLVGLTGIVMIFSEHLAEFANPLYIFGIVITFAANISWAVGSIWVKKKNENTNPFLGAGLQMSFGALAIIPLSLLFDDYSKDSMVERSDYSTNLHYCYWVDGCLCVLLLRDKKITDDGGFTLCLHQPDCSRAVRLGVVK
jgi:drug/metabolite transporter (DMT)-like permease